MAESERQAERGAAEQPTRRSWALLLTAAAAELAWMALLTWMALTG